MERGVRARAQLCDAAYDYRLHLPRTWARKSPMPAMVADISQRGKVFMMYRRTSSADITCRGAARFRSQRLVRA